MLALAAGFFGSKDLGEGLGRAAETLYGRNEALRQQGMPQLGGPDDAFEVYTDPKTGERTYKPIQQFVDYQRNKRLDPADDADMTGRAMYALSQLPKEEQAGAYEDILSNPSLYGIRDTSSMPAAFDPRWVQMATNRGMTVSQARTRDQAVQNGESAQDARERALALREQALAIAERKATASIAQGNQRIGIAREALHKRSSGSGSSGGKGSVTDMSDSDLLSFILN